MVELKEPLATLWRGKDAFAEVKKLQGDVFRELETRRTIRFELAGKSYFLKWHQGTSVKEVVKNLFSLRLPVLGRVAAGLPIGADIGSDDFVVLDRVFFSPAPDYLLKVQGDSMIDEGIFDGDLIGVHRTRDARSGQIVVARIDDEITVKLLKMGKDRIRLLPRNPDYKPIEVLPDQDFAIEGLYCGLLRPNR